MSAKSSINTDDAAPGFWRRLPFANMRLLLTNYQICFWPKSGLLIVFFQIIKRKTISKRLVVSSFKLKCALQMLRKVRLELETDLSCPITNIRRICYKLHYHRYFL